jgi:hypothetical protein
VWPEPRRAHNVWTCCDGMTAFLSLVVTNWPLQERYPRFKYPPLGTSASRDDLHVLVLSRWCQGVTSRMCTR